MPNQIHHSTVKLLWPSCGREVEVGKRSCSIVRMLCQDKEHQLQQPGAIRFIAVAN
jgi:hypothetical protein